MKKSRKIFSSLEKQNSMLKIFLYFSI